MNNMLRRAGMFLVGVTAVVAGANAQTPNAKDMTFFVTSAGPGKGGDLGGLDGADQHCQTLGAAAGAGKRTWRAYLSTQAPATSDPNFVNARDRIGKGPWHNAKGALVARDVEHLHSATNNITSPAIPTFVRVPIPNPPSSIWRKRLGPTF